MNITRNGKVDGALFDDALELIYGDEVAQGLPCRDYDQAVIDSGAGACLPFTRKMEREAVTQEFARLGYQHTLHVVIAGGQAIKDCRSDRQPGTKLVGSDAVPYGGAGRTNRDRRARKPSMAKGNERHAEYRAT